MAGEDGILKWVTVFEKDNAENHDIEIPDIDKVLAKPGKGDGGGGNKRLSVERIYQKKSQLEHILLRPDTYIGSVEKVTQPMWVYDDEIEGMVQRDITYVPGLYKIFDEILVNASDNKQRDPKGMNCIKIDIDPEGNKIKVWNNGKGIPVVEHKTEKMFVPTLIFGHLLTSSNYDDSQKKVTGGRNGYGAKLCNIFSTKFVVETQSAEYKKAFKQTWQNNMGKASEPKIVASKGDDYTSISFQPDLSKFKMERLDKDIVDLFTRRAYDIAAATRGVKVFLNGKKLAVKNFKDYVELYTKGKVDDNDTPLKVIHEIVNDRWEVALALSEKGFQQVSFVNSIATTKGGRHVDYCTDQIVSRLIEIIKKKEKKGGIQIKPFQVKNHVWVFVSCLIENPTFDSQTKENMTLQAKSFGSKCQLSDKFVTQVSKCGIVEAIQSWMKFKQQAQLNKKMSSAKHSKLKGVPKLDDANNAGTKNSMDCTLILTEGDSAKSLAVAGLGVIGRDKYGVFPLKGKLLNVREASHKQIMENAEINNIIKIMGLRYKEKYDSPESMKTLRYGRLMIMTDQDQDGSHIKGLLINFIHHNWPQLLKQKFLEEFITPIVKVHKNKQEKSFYSLPEFEEWKNDTDNWHTWRIKYYKGLGTSTAKEAKEYFMEMQRNRIPFKYQGGEDDAAITLAFSKKKIEERKEWLTNWMEERKRRSQLGLPELYLYGKETHHITYNEFVNRELILFSNMDNERSIPSLVDGLKPGQRKVMYTCFKRNLVKEMKVAQLAGSVAEHSAYHHGEQSLMGTIINLAQNFVGSNNLNLLQPIGQFGTRLHGGKDAASPRYIFTALSTLTRLVFNVCDEPLLRYMYDDSQRIEPVWYMPAIPMVLINGAEGIGTGWSTKVPNYDVREVIANLRRMIAGLEPLPMLPSFKNFKGTVEQLDEQRFIVSGEVALIDETTIEISELPVRTWTQTYKESVLEPMLQGTEKTPPFITDYKEYHTDTTVRFVVKMAADKLMRAEQEGLHKIFKLQTSISAASMVLFDHNGCIRRYNRAEEILQEFYDLRKDFYARRKDYVEGMLAAESLKLDNIARFICEKIDGIIVIENKPKKEIIQMLLRRGYDPDPVKTWKDAQNKLQAMEDRGEEEDEEEDSQSSASGAAGDAKSDFNYLLSLQLWSLTKERKDELLKQRDNKAEELYQLRKKTPFDLWTDDLDKLLEELKKVERIEKDEEAMGVQGVTKAAKGKGSRPRKMAVETQPSPMGQRVVPRIDAATKAKVEAAVLLRKKKLQKKDNPQMGPDSLFGDDADEPKSLSDRIGKVKKDPGAKKSGKQQTLFDAFKAKPAGKKPPSGDDSDDEPFTNGASKVTKKKSALQKAVILDSDSEGEAGQSVDSQTTASSAMTPEKRAELSPKKKGGAGKRKKMEYDSDLSDTEFVRKKAKGKAKPFDSDSEDDGGKKKKKRARGSDDDDDFELAEDFVPEVEPRSRTGRARKPVKYSFHEDDDEDEESEDAGDEDLSGGASRGAASSKLSDMEFDEDDLPSQPLPEPASRHGPPATATTSNGASDDLWARASGKGATAQNKDEDEDEEDIPYEIDDSPVKKAPAKKPAAKKPTKKLVDSSDDDDFFPETKKSPVAVKKRRAPAPKKPKAATRDSDDEGVGDAEAKPKKKAAPRKKAPAKKKAFDSDDDDDMFSAKSKSKGGAGGKKKKGGISDDDFDVDAADVEPRSREGRSRQQVKYNFDESDDDDMF